MTITVNDTKYTLTASQLANLKTSAALPSGRYYSERANAASEAKLLSMGLLREGLFITDPEERAALKAEAGANLEASRYAAQFHDSFETASRLAGQASRTYLTLTRKHMYLTEAALTLVGQIAKHRETLLEMHKY